MIIINELTHTYSQHTTFEKKALDSINLKINYGELIGLIGHTGSGKSTLIQHLNGLLKPTSGSVFFNGEDIFDKDYSLRKLRGKVGLVFQYPEHQLFETTVEEDVKFGPKNLKLEPLQVELRAYKALKQVGISEKYYDVSPLELSGGQKRRVAIAGVLAMEPEVLILDEPTAGLDPKGRDEILDLILSLHKERNLTVIIVSHSMEDMAKYVDRIIVMNEGQIQFDDEPAKVFAHYEELEKMGLKAPQITYVVEGLAKRGIQLPYNGITVNEVKASIMEYMKERKV